MTVNPRASRAFLWEAYLCALTIFVSAFLLFQVQPIIAKIILPWFGGSSAVWSICMLFFQMTLLAGYVYAHFLHSLQPARQVAVHAILLTASLTVLPILPNPSWKPTDASNPSFLILGLLTATIGLPYLILSTTSPLLQAWYTRRSGAVPYRLFALSNLASMLALLTYPVLIEPNLSVHAQSYIWSAGYGIFVVACGVTAWVYSRGPSAAAPATYARRSAPPPWGIQFLWIALAACASSLLLAVTTFLTQDIAAIPFLWVLPLSVYLLSFILCFESPKLYHRSSCMALLPVALGCFAYYLWPRSLRIHMGPTIAILAASLFICCMVCHGELARLKPHPDRLTSYYVMISVGGAIGGLFVGLVAPNLFNAYYEFPIALSVCAGLAVFLLVRQGLRPIFTVGLVAALVTYVLIVGAVTRNAVSGYRAVVRNFYGELRVVDEGADDEEDADRKLLHGRINHGIQMRDPQYRHTPVAYFCEASGIGHAMRARPPGKPWRVGILGLGAGALAPYGQAGDLFRIYELNPLVLDLAQTQFTYLSDTPAKIEVALGDGRLSLEREPGQQFDLLVMDAFSGDSVPVHLITREAFEIYFRHLRPGGILAVNISNRYLDLQPVMERAADHFDKLGLVFNYTAAEDDFLCNSSSWALLLEKGAPLPDSLKSGKALAPQPHFRMWTDDFSNMFSILK